MDFSVDMAGHLLVLCGTDGAHRERNRKAGTGVLSCGGSLALLFLDAFLGGVDLHKRDSVIV